MEVFVKLNRTRLLSLACASLVAACSSGSGTPSGTGGHAGSAGGATGSSGAGGTDPSGGGGAGSTGTGDAGTNGTSGTGGSATGAAGKGGSSGGTNQAGTGGAGGRGGTAGTSQAGTGGAGGRGGTSQAGTGGAGGRGGTGGTSQAGTGGAAGKGGGTAGTSPGGTTGTGGAGSPNLLIGVSSDKRYLVDGAGKPWLAAGDAPQCITTRLSTADMDAYFSMRAAQGFNAAWVNLLCNTYTGGSANGATYDGIMPFTGTTGDGKADITKPNASFFARVDACVSAAAAHGIVLFLDPIETGGFLDTIRSNGMTAGRTYGRFLGSRYASSPNIVWMSGNDFRAWQSTSDDGLVLEIALGIKDMDTRHLQTVELDYPTYMSSLDDAMWVPHIDLNLTYTYYPTYAQLYVDYNRSNHLPNIMIEGNYEAENMQNGTHLTNAHDIRSMYYWSNLAGATGSFYGNHWEVFQMDNATWKTNFAGDKGAPQMAYVKSLFEARAWWKLVPDQNHTVVTSGYGTFADTGNAQDNTYATTARVADGTLVMTYIPTARSVVVDMTKLAAAATARWYDPTTGTFTAIAGSPIANTGTHTFAPPSGNHADSYNDWVLVLETAPPP
jgi:hypothetical protein